MTTIMVSNTTLFHVAAEYLGNAVRWEEIAELNNLSDPLIVGMRQLAIPSLGESQRLYRAPN